MPLIDSWRQDGTTRRRLLTLGAAALTTLALTPAAHAATIDVLPVNVATPGYTLSTPSAPITPRLVAGGLTTKQVIVPAGTCTPAGTAVGTAVGTGQAGVAAASDSGTAPVQESRIATPQDGSAPERDHPTPPVGKPGRPQGCGASTPEEPSGHTPGTGPTGGDKSDALDDEMQRRQEQERRIREMLDEMQRQHDAMIRAHA